MAKRFTAQRRDQLARLVINEGYLSATEAAQRLNVSTETIRKDIIYLEQEGIVRKSRGGALSPLNAPEKPVIEKITEQAEAKNEIALKALDLVPENGTIILDSGTSTLALAQLLALRSDLTIFTNSSAALDCLAKSENDVFILGGRIRSSSLAVVGDWVAQQLASIVVDMAFMGTDGFAGHGGPATASFDEAEIKRLMIKSSRQSVVLADSSKFSSSTPFMFAPWSSIDVLVTDLKEQREELSRIEDTTRIVTA